MAPVCGMMNSGDYAVTYINLEDIPLPRSPPPPRYDTVDRFEVLEQTIFKQKRLQRTKKSTDMRMKVLLKRTFDLVCNIIDKENGMDEEDEDEPLGVELELTADTRGDNSLDIESYLAESEFQQERLLMQQTPQPDEFEITLQVEQSCFYANQKRRSLSDDEDEEEDDEDDDDQFCVHITMKRPKLEQSLPGHQRSQHHLNDRKKARVF